MLQVNDACVSQDDTNQQLTAAATVFSSQWMTVFQPCFCTGDTVYRAAAGE